MPKTVRLKEVTADNWEAVVDLELTDAQEDIVASNAYSLVEAKFTPAAQPRAIYAGKRIVGFLMYETLASEGKPHETSVYRFMIDRRQQGKGYGRAAFAAALDEIGATTAARKVTVCYVPQNLPAKQFYASFGFVETGLDDDGEMVAEWKLPPLAGPMRRPPRM
jgi:diamine N-acetyltransferase